MYPRTIALLACLVTTELAICLTSEGCSRRRDTPDRPGSTWSSGPAASPSTTSAPAAPGSARSAAPPVGFTFEVDPEMRTNEPRLVRLSVANKEANLQILQQEMNRLEKVTAERLRTVETQISAMLSGEHFDASPLDHR